MDMYTCKNLIIDPETQGLEDIIGKEVYFSGVPLCCLEYANENRQTGILVEIRKDNFHPFRVETSEGDISWFSCIIPKKEKPKPEFTPFTSADEFIDAYDCANYSIKNGTIENKLLNYGGIWLKGKVSIPYSMVTEIWNSGVVLAGGQSVIFWEELFEHYIFLDDTPCGKPEENE